MAESELTRALSAFEKAAVRRWVCYGPHWGDTWEGTFVSAIAPSDIAHVPPVLGEWAMGECPPPRLRFALRQVYRPGD